MRLKMTCRHPLHMDENRRTENRNAAGQIRPERLFLSGKLSAAAQQEQCQQEKPGKGFRIGDYHIIENGAEGIGAQDADPKGKNACNSGKYHVAVPSRKPRIAMLIP